MRLGCGLGITSRRGAARGPNVILNGAFNADLSNWTMGNLGWTWNAGVAQLNGDGSLQDLTQATLVNGRIYELTFDVVVTSGAGLAIVTNTGGNTVYTASATGSHRVVFQALGAALQIKRAAGAVVASIDSVVARQVI